MASTSNSSWRRRLWVGLVLAGFSVGVALLLLEGAARLLPPPYGPEQGPFYVCDEALGWTGKPNFQGVIEGLGFEQTVTFNRLGMHDTDHPRTKPANTTRILMLGDSFVQAVQVAEAESSHQILEDYLNERAGTGANQFEVISGGVINWGTNQQTLFYRQQGRHFQPDVVLLMFYIGNDFLDNLPGNVLTIQGRNCYAPYFAMCDSDLIPAPLTYAPGVSRLEGNCGTVRRGVINALGRLYQHSRLYQHLEPLAVANRPRQVFGQAYPSAFSALYLPPEEAELAQAWQVTLATLTHLEQAVEADGSRLVVALISPDIAVQLGTLSPAEREIFLRDNPRFAEANVNRPAQRLADFLTGQGIPFLDLTPPLTAHLAANKVPLYLVGDGHWTVEGNRVAGEALGQWLVEADLVGLIE